MGKTQMIYDMMVIEIRSDFPSERLLRQKVPKEIDILGIDLVHNLWHRQMTYGYMRIQGAVYKVYVRYDEKNKEQVTEWRSRNDQKKRYGY